MADGMDVPGAAQDPDAGAAQPIHDLLDRDLVLEDFGRLPDRRASTRLELQDPRPPDVLHDALREQAVGALGRPREVRVDELELQR